MTLNGRPIDGPGAERGVMFQDYALFPWRTVRGNIEFGLVYGPAGQGLSAAARDERVSRIIELVGLNGSEAQISASTLRRHAPARGAGAADGQ